MLSEKSLLPTASRQSPLRQSDAASAQSRQPAGVTDAQVLCPTQRKTPGKFTNISKMSLRCPLLDRRLLTRLAGLYSTHDVGKMGE